MLDQLLSQHGCFLQSKPLWSDGKTGVVNIERVCLPSCLAGYGDCCKHLMTACEDSLEISSRIPYSRHLIKFLYNQTGHG